MTLLSMNFISKIFNLSLILITIGHLNAAETDAFTDRYTDIPDALEIINKELNTRLNKITNSLNQGKVSCDNQSEIDSFFSDLLRKPFRGVIEDFILTNQFVPKSTLTFDQTILGKLDTYQRYLLEIGTLLGIGYSAPIRFQDLLIGADKFGHFFDEGHYYYQLVYKWNRSIEDVLAFGDFLENFIEGKSTGGVYSFSDLVANYEGFLFWKELYGGNFNWKNSYYMECNQHIWSIKNSIKMERYLNAAWDEGMNCNEYLTESMTKSIESSIENLENKYKKRFQCPVYPEKVQVLIDRYHKYSKYLLNPKLR